MIGRAITALTRSPDRVGVAGVGHRGEVVLDRRRRARSCSSTRSAVGRVPTDSSEPSQATASSTSRCACVAASDPTTVIVGGCSTRLAHDHLGDEQTACRCARPERHDADGDGPWPSTVESCSQSSERVGRARRRRARAATPVRRRRSRRGRTACRRRAAMSFRSTATSRQTRRARRVMANIVDASAAGTGDDRVATMSWVRPPVSWRVDARR